MQGQEEGRDRRARLYAGRCSAQGGETPPPYELPTLGVRFQFLVARRHHCILPMLALLFLTF